MAKKKIVIPKNETKRDRFKRVVTPRVNKALKYIGLVGNQAGGAYEYKKEDVADIMAALRDAVDSVEAQYSGEGKAESGFKLR